MKSAMKKVIAILLVVCMLCPLIAACNDTNGGNNTNGGAQVNSPSGEPSGESKEITVTFSANGGSFANGDQSISQKVKSGDTMTAPESPKKEGYTFKGWSSEKNGSALWNFATDTANSDITLYATWAQRSATIFSMENATIKESDIFLLVDSDVSSVSLSSKVVCSDDSTWKLYYDKLGQTEIPTKIAAGMDGALKNGDNIFYMVVTSNDGTQVNVYELTIHRSYMVPIIYCNGSEVLKTENVYTGVKTDITYQPDIDGYTFVEWQDMSGKTVSSITLWEPQSLYASKTANKYTVTYDANGGTLSEENTTVTYGQEYTFAVPIRTGYSFTGWYTTSGTQLTDSYGMGVMFWNINFNTTAIAHWSTNTYNLSLNKNISAAGTVSGSGNYEYGNYITINATTNEGYRFIGWYDSNNLLLSQDESYDFIMGLDAEITAKWEYADITLHYVVNGEIKNTQTYRLNDHINLRNVSPDVGTDVFFGWYSSSVLSTSTTKLTSTSELTVSENKAYVYGGTHNGTSGITLRQVGDSCHVSGYTGTETNVIIPSTFNGKSVKYIDSSAFKDCINLTSITIPNSVTRIDSEAFHGCYKLVEVYNFSSLNISKGSSSNGYVGYYALDVYTSDSAESKLHTTDDGYIFYVGESTVYLLGYLGSDTELTLPNGYNGSNYEIYQYAFRNFSSLTSITIPNSVTSIGKSALEGCSNLVSISLPIGNTHFGYIFGASSYSYNKAYVPASLKTVIITGGNSICDDAFYNCSSLTSITIPNSVTSIGASAFYNCSSLTSITIPSSVTSIGASAFDGCSNLNTVTFESEIKLDCISEYTFSGCSSLTNLIIPGSVVSIGQYAFQNCSSLETVSFESESQLQSISGYAFKDCTNLINITIPNSVTSIHRYAFEGCSSLIETENGVSYVDRWVVGYSGNNAKVVLRSNTAAIGNYAFYDCSNLTSITIPNSVTRIGDAAFEGCSNLNAVYINDISAWCNIEFTNASSNPLFYAKNLYVNGSLVTDLVIPDTVTSIGSYAFRNCSSLTSITIPNSVTSIGSYAFSGCSSLNAVYIDDISAWYNIEFISDTSNPLYYAKNLYVNGSLVTDLVIPDTVTSIGSYAFIGCYALESITFANTRFLYRTTSSDSWSSKTDGILTNVSNASTNATHFKDTYYNYYWYKY